MMLFLLLLNGAAAIALFVIVRRQSKRLIAAGEVLASKQSTINELRQERTAHLATIQSQQRQITSLSAPQRSMKAIVEGPAQIKPFIVGVAPLYDNNGFPTTQLAFKDTELL